MSNMNIIPLVSILIPVYNVEKYIERCVRSVFEQTYENLEFIFVDDCTPDNSIAIIEQVLAEYPDRVSEVRIIKHNQNEGIAITRNNAISNATGDFVFFVDSDDYIEADAIEELVNLQQETNADIVTGRRFLNEDIIDSRYVEPIYNTKEDMLETILSNIWHHEITGRLMNRLLFVNNDIKALPNVNCCEDWQMTAKVVYYANTCVTHEKFTYHYVINPYSLVHSCTEWVKKKNAYSWECSSLENLIEFFGNTKYKGIIYPFFVRRMTDLIDLGIKHHDEEFFKKCRSRMFSIPSKYHQYMSKVKLFCIRFGYNTTNCFLFLHHIKQRIKFFFV